MAFIPSCGWIAAIAANNSARMRRLQEDEEKKKKQKETNSLLFGKGVNFKVYEKMNVKFRSFEIDDLDFNYSALDSGMNKRLRNEVGNKKIINVQIVPFKVKHKKVEKWKVFVMYED